MTIVTLGDVATWGSGGTPKRSVAEYFGPGVPWLSIADLNDGVVHSAKESLTHAGIANSAAKVVPRGTIFIAMYGSIGKLGIAGTEMATSQAIAFAQPRDDVVDRQYLFHYLLTQRGYLQARGRGGTQMNIGQGDLKAWPIPIPSLSKQREIAAILDRANAIRTKRRQILAHLDSLTQSIFHDMFSDVSRRAPLGDLGVNFVSGRNVLGGNLDSHSMNRVIKVSAVSSGTFIESESKPMPAGYTPPDSHRLHNGDILFGRASGSLELLGAMAIVDTTPLDLYLPDKVWKLTTQPDGPVDSNYIFGLLRSAAARRYIEHNASGAAGVRNISKARMLEFQAPVPQRQFQREFAARAQQVNTIRAPIQRALVTDDELFASLQSRAFRGEL